MPSPSIGLGYEEEGLTLRIKGEEAAGDPKSGSRDAFSEPIAAERHGPGQRNIGGRRWNAVRSPIKSPIAIMALIKLANFKSGDQLPTEAQMTLAFGVSRPPLREALKRTMRARDSCLSTPSRGLRDSTNQSMAPIGAL
jgi:Bacterial regulatory proteins, gntR family